MKNCKYLDFDNGQVYRLIDGKTLWEVEDMSLPNCMYDYRPEQVKALVVDICSECGNEIYEGEEYYDFYGKPICEDCMIQFKKEACIDG